MDFVFQYTVNFFALTLLKHIAAVRFFCSYVLRTQKMPHTKFGKDQIFLKKVIGDLARALGRWTDKRTTPFVKFC